MPYAIDYTRTPERNEQKEKPMHRKKSLRNDSCSQEPEPFRRARFVCAMEAPQAEGNPPEHEHVRMAGSMQKAQGRKRGNYAPQGSARHRSSQRAYEHIHHPSRQYGRDNQYDLYADQWFAAHQCHGQHEKRQSYHMFRICKRITMRRKYRRIEKRAFEMEEGFSIPINDPRIEKHVRHVDILRKRTVCRAECRLPMEDERDDKEHGARQ